MNLNTNSCALFALALVGCTKSPQPEPVHYPSLPKPTGVAVGEPAFEPAPELSLLSVACRASELVPANALDDDCNGRIDDGVGGSVETGDAGAPVDQLWLALSIPASSQLTVQQRASNETGTTLTPSCEPGSSFCTHMFEARELRRGETTLVVSSAAAANDAGAPAERAAVVLSVQSHGKVTSWVAPVAAATPAQVLGKLYLP